MPSDYTAAQLLAGKFTLNQVDDMVHDGRVSEQVANEYFQEWVKGKIEHRWNAEKGVPEECTHSVVTGRDTWRTMRWG
jgi:hypothetical protein